MVSPSWQKKLHTALLRAYGLCLVYILCTAGGLWALITQGRQRHLKEYVMAGGVQWLCRWGTLSAVRIAQHLFQDYAYPRLAAALTRRGLAMEEYHSKSNGSTPEIRGLWLRKPGSKPDVIILEVHGGGMSVGSARNNMYAMTRALGYLERDHGVTAHVLSIDYPLAPEHPYPAAHNCVVAAMDAVLEVSRSACTNGPFTHLDGHTTTTTKQDPVPVFLMGDSAGANLVVSALLVRATARQAGAPAGPSPVRPPFAGALLTSPWFDLSSASCIHTAGSQHLWPCRGVSDQGSNKADARDCSCTKWYRRAAAVDMLVPSYLHKAAGWYTAGGAAASTHDKLVSPARADAQETAAALRSQLATPALVVAGGDEVLLPDIGDWVERVNAAGCKLSSGDGAIVTLHTEPGAVHDYPVLLGRGTQRVAEYVARCTSAWAQL